MIRSALSQAIDRPVTPEELRDALERPILRTERDEVVSFSPTGGVTRSTVL